MSKYGLLIFDDTKANCKVILKNNERNDIYILNEKNALILFRELLNHKQFLSQISHPSKDKICIKLNSRSQKRLIEKIITGERIKAKKVIPREIVQKLIAAGLIITSIATIKLASSKSEKASVNINSDSGISSLDNGNNDSNNDNIYVDYDKEDEETSSEDDKEDEDEEDEEISDASTDYYQEEEDSTYSELEDESGFQYLDLKDIELDDSDYEKYQIAVDKYYSYFDKYGKMYGIDPLLLSYIATQERGTHSDKIDEGGGLGLCQIQVGVIELNVLNIDATLEDIAKNYVNKNIITCYNIEEQKEDKLLPLTEYSELSLSTLSESTDLNVLNGVTTLNVKNVEDNVRLCAVIMANHLKAFDNNIIPAIVAYNQGRSAVKGYIKEYADEMGIDEDEAIKGIGWMKCIPDDYGDKNYLYNTLRYAIASGSNEITCTSRDGEDITLIISGENIKEQTHTR